MYPKLSEGITSANQSGELPKEAQFHSTEQQLKFCYIKVRNLSAEAKIMF